MTPTHSPPGPHSQLIQPWESLLEMGHTSSLSKRLLLFFPEMVFLCAKGLKSVSQ